MVSRPWYAVVVAASLLGACSKKDRNTCEYWVDKLAQGEQVQEGIRRAGELQCVSALPALAAFYEKGETQQDVFDATVRIGDHEGALPLLRMALKSNDHSKDAAHIIGDWKLKSAKPELVALLTDDQYVTLREPVLDALLKIEEPKNVEDVLIHVAGTDINAQSYLVNKTAIEKLAELKSTKATPTLIKMAFARSMKGQEVFRWVRRALAEIGDPSLVDQLFAVMAGKNDAVKAQVKAAGFDDWEWQTGPKVVQLLTDTLDPRVVEPMAQNLAADLKKPVNATPLQEERWSVHQKNRLKFIMFALSHIGSEVPIETLSVVLGDRYKDTLNQRMNAANALAFIGSEAAQDRLIDAFRRDQSEHFKAALLQIIALGIDDRKLPLWDLMIEEKPFPGEKPTPKPRRPPGAPPEEIPSAAVKAVLEGNETLKTYLAVQKACGADLGCHLDKVRLGTRDEKVKALVNLARGRMGATEDIRHAIFDAFKNAERGDVDTRRFALIALTRLGDAKDGEKLLELSRAMPEPPPPGVRPPTPDPDKPEEAPPDIYYKDEIWVIGHAMARRK
ncbi:MAG: HEAT repeat domain-containing protein [Deltaproteobacteria bacterium]|nr:HEAT repeat domain-containing protein [Deltaproteobacteria bacterium]